MKRKGFTLIELVVVLGLMTILFAISILTPINNYNKEVIVVESQIETILYNAIINSNAYVYDFYIEISDDTLGVYDTEGNELDKIVIGEVFNIEFENTVNLKKLEIENGFIKREDISKLVGLSIESSKENRKHKYDLSIDGKLIKKE